MDFFVIGLTALLASALTLFSGFGLGTLLLPAFVIYFPVEVAVALTGIVHLSNNLFKLTLVGKDADRTVVLRFGLMAVVGSVAGAFVLIQISGAEPLVQYTLFGHSCVIRSEKIVIALLMIGFVLLEWKPVVSFDRGYLPLGGLLSGFFGGLSGHQGALRSAFLVRCELTKEAFIGSGVVVACLVDIPRLSVYLQHTANAGISYSWPILITATGCAFAGAFVGSRMVEKVTLAAIQKIVAFMLAGIALGLGIGWF